jgi:UDP-glucose 4-epimerase
MGRRVLVTGANTFWGGRVIQALEPDPDIDVILGLGTHSPSVPFERAEFVRADQAYAILHRIVRAAQVDTIVHTFLVVDSTQVSARALHEINVIGTMNLLAAAGASDAKVRRLVVKSSTMVYGSSPTDPAMFHEDTPRSSPPTTRMERSLLEAETLVRDFAEDNPDTAVTVLRFGNVLGADIVTPISRNLARRLCPCIFGFDPLLQFLEEEDVIRALEFVTHRELPGIFNVAGSGLLPWSEVAAICGTRLVPLPPVQTRHLAAPLIRLGLVDLPPELDRLLRYGRGVDTSRLQQAGFEYRFTSAGAVESFARALRLRRSAGRPPAAYTYEHDVEQFFRHSPWVTSSDG